MGFGLLKNINPGKFTLTVLIIASMLACKKDPLSGTKPTRGNVRVEFSMGLKEDKIPAGNESRTSSIDGLNASHAAILKTRAVEDEDVSNLWILQFGQDGNSLITPLYLTSGQLVKNTKAGYTTYGFVAEMAESENSTVYLVANTGNPSLFTTALTLTQFRDMRLTFTSYSEIKTKGDVMVGSYTGSIPSTPQPFAWLERIVSKVGLEVNYSDPLQNAGGTLNLTSTQMRSIPLTASFAPQQSPFPASGLSENGTYTTSGLIYGDPRNQNTIFYITENLRGEKNAITDEKLKWRENDPSWENGISYATHLVMRGTYDPGNLPNVGLATITLYPGENNHNDYNIIRNSSYVMRADISDLKYEDGPDKDYRIEIDYDPFIIYRYYYEKDSYDNDADKYEYIGEDYLTGDTIISGASIAVTAEILNALKHLVPAGGDYKDGVADPDPLVVSADNRQNVVEIYYDLNVVKNYTVQINYLRETTNTVLRQPRFVTYPEGTQLSISMLKSAGLAPDGIVGDDGNDYQRVVPTGETSVRLTVDQEGLKWNLVYRPLSITTSQRYIKYHYVYGDENGPEIQPSDLVLATAAYYYPYNAPNYLIPSYAFIGSVPESIQRTTIPQGTMADMYIIYTDGQEVTFNYVENGTGMVLKDPIKVWLPLDETFDMDDIMATEFYTKYRQTVYNNIVIFNNNAYELMPEITTGLPFTVALDADHNVTFSYQCISYIECWLYDIMVNSMWAESSGVYYLGPGAVFDRIEVMYTWPDGSTEYDGSTFNPLPGEGIFSLVILPKRFAAYDIVTVTYKLYLKDTPEPIVATALTSVRPLA